MKRTDIDIKEYLAQPRQRPSELERARMRRVLEGSAKPDPPAGASACADAVLSEMRAMRSEMASLRELLSGQAPANDEILSRRQTAEMLGMNVETVTRLARREGLPCKRVGKEYRFLRSQVLAWLAARGAK